MPDYIEQLTVQELQRAFDKFIDDHISSKYSDEDMEHLFECFLEYIKKYCSIVPRR